MSDVIMTSPRCFYCCNVTWDSTEYVNPVMLTVAICIRVTAQWSHQANLTTSPLVACATASTVQDRCPGLPVSKRPGTVVLGRRRLQRPFVWLCDVHGPSTATGVLPLLAHECGTLCQPN